MFISLSLPDTILTIINIPKNKFFNISNFLRFHVQNNLIKNQIKKITQLSKFNQRYKKNKHTISQFPL